MDNCFSVAHCQHLEQSLTNPIIQFGTTTVMQTMHKVGDNYRLQWKELQQNGFP